VWDSDNQARAPAARPAPAPARPGRRRRRAMAITFWVLFCLAGAVFVAGIAVVLAGVQLDTVASTSMENTIQPGNQVLVSTSPDLRRGDIILFRRPAASGPALYVKRMIGRPGDRVACCNAQGRVTVNGRPLDESYLHQGEVASATPFSVTLGPGQIWVLGDNRSISIDSRAWGPVSLGNVVGRVFAVRSGLRVVSLRTPQTFVDGGLAPPDHRRGLGRRAPLAAGAAGLAILTIAGLTWLVTGLVIRRRRS
jgi:signal peptidase I